MPLIRPPASRDIWLSFLLNMALVVLLFFSSIFTGTYLSNQTLIEHELQSRARAFFQSILTTRSWNARHGGVYVEKRPGVESNPFLENPDIVTVDGVVYTLKNPALMTREISELAKNRGFFEFHITSLKPINPVNKPDDFERESLLRFDNGEKERFVETKDNGSTVFRYMAPLYVEEACLKCHRKQGYRLGDVRGGISVTFNIDAVRAHLQHNRWYTIALFLLSTSVLLIIMYRMVASLMHKISVVEEQLRKNAITDVLTGLYNRRHLEDRLATEISRAHRYRQPLSCVMFDIDHFKQVNDTYGHDCGDKVLMAVAKLAKEHERASDIVARYGGEEFVMLLPNTASQAAHHVAEKLRKGIAGMQISSADGNAVSVTASFGVTELPQHTEGGITSSELLSAVDVALYQAKSMGRNRTVVRTD
jgi:diguanylate cyclase (GGDEF)-like protein